MQDSARITICCALVSVTASVTLLMLSCQLVEPSGPGLGSTATPLPVAATSVESADSPSTPGAQPSAHAAKTPTAGSTTGTLRSPPSNTASPQSQQPTGIPDGEPDLIEHGDRSLPYVALTFDACQSAGWAAGYDAAIIRTLTETHTAATLFLGGLWAESHPSETQLLASIPYFEVGNHSWSHIDFAQVSKEKMSAEIRETQETIFRLTGRRPTLFRLPYGTYNDAALRVIAAHGLKTIQWDVVTGDPDPGTGAADILRVVEDQACNGSIIIMHMNERGWHTAEALPRIIELLLKKGLHLVTVSELLRCAAAPATN